MHRPSQSLRVVTGFVLTVFGLTSPAAACSVCYGAAENSMIDGGQNAILFMLLLTYLLLGGGVFLMIAMRRRVAQSMRGNE